MPNVESSNVQIDPTHTHEAGRQKSLSSSADGQQTQTACSKQTQAAGGQQDQAADGEQAKSTDVELEEKQQKSPSNEQQSPSVNGQAQASDAQQIKTLDEQPSQLAVDQIEKTEDVLSESGTPVGDNIDTIKDSSITDGQVEASKDDGLASKPDPSSR